MNRPIQQISTVLSLALTAATLACASSDSASVRRKSETTTGEGREIFEKRCDVCHALPTPASRDAIEWRGVLVTMAREAKLSTNEKATLLHWLTENSRR